MLQVHGKLAASPSKPEAAPGLGDMLRLMWEAAQKPILWYLTLMGFLVGAAAASFEFWVYCLFRWHMVPGILSYLLSRTAVARTAALKEQTDGLQCTSAPQAWQAVTHAHL